MQARAVMLDFVPKVHLMACTMFKTYSTLQRLFMNQLCEVIYSLHVHYTSYLQDGHKKLSPHFNINIAPYTSQNQTFKDNCRLQSCAVQSRGNLPTF
jgi:hypothetical protein